MYKKSLYVTGRNLLQVRCSSSHWFIRLLESLFAQSIRLQQVPTLPVQSKFDLVFTNNVKSHGCAASMLSCPPNPLCPLQELQSACLNTMHKLHALSCYVVMGEGETYRSAGHVCGMLLVMRCHLRRLLYTVNATIPSQSSLLPIHNDAFYNIGPCSETWQDCPNHMAFIRWRRDCSV